jgi:hypothetical protein
MKTSSAKDKGRRLQKKVARMISDLTGLEFGRDCPIQSRPMGQTGPDVCLDTEARVRFPFTVECKNQENWSIPAWIKQAEANLYPSTDWLLVICKNRTRPIVVMDLEGFFQILERAKRRERTK